MRLAAAIVIAGAGLLVSGHAGGQQAAWGTGLGVNARLVCCTLTSCNCKFQQTPETGRVKLNPQWLPWTYPPDGGAFHTASEDTVTSGCYVQNAITIGPEGGIAITNTNAPGGTTCVSRDDGGQLPADYLLGSVQATTFAIEPPYTIEVDALVAAGNGWWPTVWAFNSQCQQPNLLFADSLECQFSGTEELDTQEGFEQATAVLDSAEHNQIGGSQVIFWDVISTVRHTYTAQVVSATEVNFFVDGAIPAGSAVLALGPSHPMYPIWTFGLGGSGSPDPSHLPMTEILYAARISKP